LYGAGEIPRQLGVIPSRWRDLALVEIVCGVELRLALEHFPHPHLATCQAIQWQYKNAGLPAAVLTAVETHVPIEMTGGAVGRPWPYRCRSSDQSDDENLLSYTFG
jgi:hypothetical protein